MRALITGHEGFVGSHFARALQANGDEVTGFDNRVGLGNDVRDRLPAMMQADGVRYQPDVVIHCAANVGGRTGIDNKQLWQSENYDIDRVVFQYVQAMQPRAFIYFSSSAVYPTTLQKQGEVHDLREDMRADWAGTPDQTYGRVKLQGEAMLPGLLPHGTSICLRPFSGYGVGQSPDYPMTAIVDRVCKARRGEEFYVWGPAGAERDWIHIDDIVRGTLGLLENVDATQRGEVITTNLCTGRGTSFTDLVRKVALIAGKRIAGVSSKLDSPTGVYRRVGDPTYMKSLGIDTQVSLEEGIYEMVKAAGR